MVKAIFWRSGRFVAVRCVNFTCANKNGCSKSYLLDLPVCAILECNCLQRRSSGKIFRITLYSEFPDLPYRTGNTSLVAEGYEPKFKKRLTSLWGTVFGLRSCSLNSWNSTHSLPLTGYSNILQLCHMMTMQPHPLSTQTTIIHADPHFGCHAGLCTNTLELPA